MNDVIKNFELYLENETDFSKHTIDSYRKCAEQFFSQYKEFSQENARDFIHNLSQVRKPATVMIRISGLCKLAEFLEVPIKLRRVKKMRSLELENIINEDEYNRICDFLKDRGVTKKNGNDYFLMVKILGTTGCRISELQKMTYEMVSSGEAVILGKGNKYRRFFFTEELKSLCSGKSGKIMKVSTRGFATYLHEYVSKDVGIDREKMHPHAFRHFFAKMYLKQTKDVVQLAELLGHASVDTTRLYLQKSKEEQLLDYNQNVVW